MQPGLPCNPLRCLVPAAAAMHAAGVHAAAVPLPTAGWPPAAPPHRRTCRKERAEQRTQLNNQVDIMF